MKRSLLRSVLAWLTAGLPLAVGGQVYWDTTPSWVGFAGVAIFGNEAYGDPNFGQTFVAPAGVNAMQAYTVWLDDRNNPDPVRFTANLVEWDGARPTGPILYTSVPVTTSNNHGRGGMEEVAFALPDVPVVSGRQYLAFLSSIGVSGSRYGSAFVGVVNGPGVDALPSGKVYMNSLAFSTADLYVKHWADIQPSTDLAFRATFALIPEPGALLPALTAMALLAGRQHRRLKR